MVRCSLCVSLFAICTSPRADFYVPPWDDEELFFRDLWEPPLLAAAQSGEWKNAKPMPEGELS
jgi:hypothetical protein